MVDVVCDQACIHYNAIGKSSLRPTTNCYVVAFDLSYITIVTSTLLCSLLNTMYIYINGGGGGGGGVSQTLIT